MKKPLRLSVGTFVSTLVLSLCLFGLVALFLLIDCNMQQTMTGQITPPATFTLEDGRPLLTTRDGETLTILPPVAKQWLSAICGTPIRAACWLVHQEQRLVASLLERFASQP